MSNTNRTRGNNAERYYATKFRELGYSKCITSREGSKLLDDCAVDLMFLPVLIQVKAGKQKGISPSKILSDMKERIKEKFPDDAPEQEMPKLLIHYKGTGRGVKRTEYDELVTMTFETFVKFFKSYTNDLISRQNSNNGI